MRNISEIYPTVGPFEGVNLNEHKLLEHGYLVVLDSDKKFYGILTPNDIVERPHKTCPMNKKQPLYNCRRGSCGQIMSPGHSMMSVELLLFFLNIKIKQLSAEEPPALS